MLVGAIAEGETRIVGFGRSADTESTIAAMRALGVEVLDDDVDTLRVRGRGLTGLDVPAEAIECGNAGTLMRMLPGILAGQSGRQFELVGDESLSARPMERVAVPLRRMGAAVRTTDGHAPLAVDGAELHAIDYELPVPSAQVKSAVLLAGSTPTARRPSSSGSRRGTTPSAFSNARARRSGGARRASASGRPTGSSSTRSRSRATSPPRRRSSWPP